MICCLPLSPGIRLGQADRLDDLADLALVGRALEGLGGQEPVADELLGDRRGTARPAGDRVEPGADDAERVEAGLIQKSLSSIAVVASRISPGISSNATSSRLEGPEAGELDLARSVVDDRLLLEIEVGRAATRGPAGRRRSGCTRPRRSNAPARGQQHADEEDDDGMATRMRRRVDPRFVRAGAPGRVGGAAAAREWSASGAAR